VLINKIDPANAVKEFTNLIDTVNGFDVTDEETLAEFADCTEEGQILLWHSWTEKETTAWQIVIDKFHELCPSIELQLKNVPADNITEQLESLNSAKPDLFLARHNSINPLREAELLKDITSLVDKDSLVNYTPEAISAVRYQEQLYGIPQTLNTQALYYNKDMVETPVSNLDELLKVASPKKQVGLNPNFKESFWGAATLGCAPCQSGQLFDEVGTSTLATGSDFAAWSSWLKIAGGQEGMVFNTDQQQLQTMFANGELAYVVADSSALNSFQEILGKAKVGVTTLPTGPTSEEGMASKARPFLEVDTFLFNNGINEIQLSLALKFAKFANLQKNQTLLLQEGNFIPTNKLATAINSDAAIGSFINQVATTIILPDAQKMELLETASGMAK
jgi:maltose-binding protein MalE